MKSIISKTKKFFPAIFLLMIILFSSVLFFFRLGDAPLWDFDEVTYVQVARNTLDSDNRLSLIGPDNKSYWFDKPPLCFWAMMASIKLFGASEFALRLPYALFGLMGIILVWLLAYQLSNNYWIAHLSSIILLLSGDFVFAARQVRMDAAVTTAIIFAVYGFVKGWKNPKWYLGFGAGIAIGIMIKSVIGILAIPIALIFSLVYSRWDWIKDKFFWLSVLFGVLIAAPWHIYETIKFGADFWNSYFIFHVAKRVYEPIAGGDGRAIVYYIKNLFIYIEPWFPLLLVLAGYLIYKHKLKFSQYPKLQLASLLSALFILFIFSIPVTKLWFYLEPMYPFLAIFVAAFFVEILLKRGREGRIQTGLIMVIFILVGFINTYSQIMNMRSKYTYENTLAEEEKKIGLYLSENVQRENIYAIDHVYLNTLWYYSNHNIIPINSSINLSGRFYFILSKEYHEQYSRHKGFREKSELIIEGDKIVLVAMDAGEETVKLNVE
ncbi:hypothetical protein A2303_07535 [Candidatus Falkowbacteria bacterium RIFOXYB2_FULL_47_14]|uniref:Glycosyltransferase RgtA/B/C/D-like domain-containing protein n=1 Tax=Candidatus Falkowbacteria bacterium RIFOXYA2_FULL_47_19 TaxID=1797994 RepID=A0A1F5SGJ6_9BACT|nr:MAG: hypothetical protein A2227_01285 [Candidatus Falkowbacteria bacterium RIFOXYA2_FULL_47_19]OGF34995.1 MAG: hypothetical protein A2468_07240 [Candidatus Falkowbacteria bacterium RIFOXYC2_FULL_46_15]OGF43711.1 MAG: hypothetical protein A2303_07535 [Candidatus Falkowbacteria bacterium RIFOXYB2_FULL_47_14]